MDELKQKIIERNRATKQKEKEANEKVIRNKMYYTYLRENSKSFAKYINLCNHYFYANIWIRNKSSVYFVDMFLVSKDTQYLR